MRFLNALPWILLGVLMVLHGFAHLPAVLGSWGLATFDDVSFQPNVLLTGAGDNLVRVLGAVWFLAAVSYVVAGIGVLRRAYWWPLLTAVAIVLSLPMTMLWREDAVIGLVLNSAILALMAGWLLIGLQRTRQPA